MNKDQILNVLLATIFMLGTGLVLALLLAVADKYLTVEVDPRITEVTKMLPGYNCGGCGYSGCSGLATGLVEGTATKVSCAPCKPENKQKIKDYLASTPASDGKTVTVQI